MNIRRIIVCTIILLVCSGIVINTYNNLEGTKVEEIEEKTSNMLTFHVQQDSGSYATYTSGNFPSGSYQINQDKTTCTDVYGNKINTTLKYSSGSIIVNGSDTVYCEVYLDKCKIPDIFKETYTAADFSQINACMAGDLYRYQGTDNVNNYLCFGTNEKDKCLSNPDKYMYRVIGLTSTGQMKIIKDTALVEDNEDKFYWNYHNNNPNYCSSTGDDCTWPKVMLYERLNGISNGTTKGSRGDTNLYLNRTDDYYDLNTRGVQVEAIYSSSTFPNRWIELIEEHQWKYGDVTEESVANLYNGDKLYEIENNFTQTVTAKIGLLYIHDFSYAYLGGNPGSSTVARNAWINKYNVPSNSSPELYLTRYGGSPHGSPYYCGWYNAYGNHFYNDALDGATGSYYVRPVFYTNMKLCNSINGSLCYYLIGTGLSTDPLRIVYYY